MSSGESAETWLEKGAEAFASMRMTEAGQAFQSAVTSDPLSAKAHLCLGVIKFFEYQNGVSMQPDLPQDYLETLRNWKPGSPPPPRPPDIRPLDPAIKSARIIEQNSTNGAKAEEHLKRALELEPRYEPAMEYLAALYFRWLDPVNHLPVRLEMARQRYTRILDTNPQHTFANYVMGVIDYERAFTIIRSETGFPRPLVDEERRRSLRAQAGPLLAESARNFVRSLELDPNNRNAMTYLMFVRRDQAYITRTSEEAARDNAEADALHQKVYQIMEKDAKASGQQWPPDDAASITFVAVSQRSGGKLPIPSFPPDARLMTVPLAPPPPSPAMNRIVKAAD